MRLNKLRFWKSSRQCGKVTWGYLKRPITGLSLHHLPPVQCTVCPIWSNQPPARFKRRISTDYSKWTWYSRHKQNLRHLSSLCPTGTSLCASAPTIINWGQSRFAILTRYRVWTNISTHWAKRRYFRHWSRNQAVSKFRSTINTGKTAFTSHHGLFRFKRISFRLESAPGTFKMVVDVILAILKW